MFHKYSKKNIENELQPILFKRAILFVYLKINQIIQRLLAIVVSYDGIHEVFEGDVQYPYADIGGKELLHISEVNEDNRRTYNYVCPYCKKPLRPRLGLYRAHCFAHKKGERCDPDRYIHRTAIDLLEQKWNRDEPFEIKMTVRFECEEYGNCFFHYDSERSCVREEVKTYDLKKHYSRCLVEKKVGEFIPDLCLIDDTGKHEPIFIEIWSKHKNSEKKAESEYMIIEIRLKTTAELEELPKHPITESETVTFSHFKTSKGNLAEKSGLSLMRYTLYGGSLKSYVDEQTVNCKNFRNNHHPKAIFEIDCIKEEVYSSMGLLYYGNALAIDKGYDIRLCYLCQEYGPDRRRWRSYYDDSNAPMGCCREIDTRGFIECKQNDAKTCPFFKLDSFQVKRNVESIENFKRYIWYKNPDGSSSEEYQQRKSYQATNPNYVDLNLDIDVDR